MDWYLIVSSSHHPAWNLALEECILDSYTTLPHEAAVLLFYVNDRCIVIGKHQNPWLEVCWDCIEQSELPLFRRISGGGAVYHDRGNLNFSFIQPRTVFSKEENLSLIQRALRNLGIEVARTSRGDLFYRNWKVSGNALCYRRDRVLHHGTLLIDADLSTLQRSLAVSSFLRERFRSPAVPSVGSITANLKESFPFLSVSMVIEAVTEAVSSEGSTVIQVEDPGRIVQKEKFQSIFNRHGTWEWVFGATPSFWFETAQREPHYKGSCKVEAGRIVEVNGIDDKYVGRSFDPLFFSKSIPENYVTARREP